MPNEAQFNKQPTFMQKKKPEYTEKNVISSKIDVFKCHIAILFIIHMQYLWMIELLDKKTSHHSWRSFSTPSWWYTLTSQVSRLISKSNINTFLKRNFGYFIGTHQVVLIKFDVITSTCLSHIFKYVISFIKNWNKWKRNHWTQR